MPDIIGEHTARLAEEKKPKKEIGADNPDDFVPELDRYGQWTTRESERDYDDMGYSVND